MIGWILAGLLLSAAIIITVSYLNSEVAKRKAKEKVPNAVSLMVKEVYSSGNVNRIKMDALDDYGNSTEVTFEADDVAYDIYEGKRIPIDNY